MQQLLIEPCSLTCKIKLRGLYDKALDESLSLIKFDKISDWKVDKKCRPIKCVVKIEIRPVEK